MNERACELCGRITKRGVTAHHLIPRTLHSNKWFKKRFTREQMRQTIDVCRDCHSAIHHLAPDEKDLGRHYNTVEKLRNHPELANFLAWVQKQK
jgi:hypothetical protein